MKFGKKKKESQRLTWDLQCLSSKLAHDSIFCIFLHFSAPSLTHI